jgi:hypothetical protein
MTQQSEESIEDLGSPGRFESLSVIEECHVTLHTTPRHQDYQIHVSGLLPMERLRVGGNIVSMILPKLPKSNHT